MNSTQILKMMKEIFRDVTGEGRASHAADVDVMNVIIRLYNTTEIDWEECKWLWVNYLYHGNLDIAEAVRKANTRIRQEILADMNKQIERKAVIYCA